MMHRTTNIKVPYTVSHLRRQQYSLYDTQAEGKLAEFLNMDITCNMRYLDFCIKFTTSWKCVDARTCGHFTPRLKKWSRHDARSARPSISVVPFPNSSTMMSDDVVEQYSDKVICNNLYITVGWLTKVLCQSIPSPATFPKNCYKFTNYS